MLHEHIDPTLCYMFVVYIFREELKKEARRLKRELRATKVKEPIEEKEDEAER